MSGKIVISVKIDPECEGTQVTIRAGKRTEQVENIIKTIRQCEDAEDIRITVYDGDRMLMLDQSDIVRVYVENRRLSVCTLKGKYLSRMTLHNFEKMLNDEAFARISRFEIVNLKMAVGFDISVAGTIGITFEDGSKTWVARRCVRDIQDRLRKISKGGMNCE